MHSGIERRGDHAPRIPLDLWVRLSHEDYEEPFDADSVDLSRGGLALRSDYLPEIGDRLRCHFGAPPEGDPLSLDGEVVWAHDAGGRSGQFGLRFTTLDADDEARLAAMVAHLGPEAAAGGRVRLHLDGVASPVEADVVKHEDDWLTAEQSLPFLKLGMGVVVEGSFGPPRGRLAAVDVRVVDGIPRLVLQVDLEQEADAAPARAIAAEPTRMARIDTNAAQDALQIYDRDADADLDGGDEDDEDDEGMSLAPNPDTTLEDYLPPSVSRARTDEVAVVRHTARDAITADDEEAVLQREREEIGASSLFDRARPFLVMARARSAVALTAVRAKTGPWFAAFVAKLGALFVALRQRGGPATERVYQRTRAVALALFGKVAQKARGKARRRTTATPPTRVAESPKLRRQRAEQEEVPEAPRRHGRRIVAVGALVLIGVGAGVYAFSGDEPAPAPSPVVVAPVAAPGPAPVLAAPAAVLPAPAIEAAPAAALAPSAELPPAEALPPPRVGQLEAPTFPTLSDAQARRDSPIREGTRFGATEVTNGRAVTIRMSQPVTILRGQAQDGGFTVTIPGSLALDRAGPLAAGNPSIERATILNRGDHAVLTVRFVAGRDPAYQVVAAGAAIRITVGR